MSEEIKNYVSPRKTEEPVKTTVETSDFKYTTDETALEALSELDGDHEQAVQFAAGEGLSTDELEAHIELEKANFIADAAGEGFGVQSEQEVFPDDKYKQIGTVLGPSVAYLNARLTLLEQDLTETKERIAKTFNKAGFKF